MAKMILGSANAVECVWLKILKSQTLKYVSSFNLEFFVEGSKAMNSQLC